MNIARRTALFAHKLMSVLQILAYQFRKFWRSLYSPARSVAGSSYSMGFSPCSINDPKQQKQRVLSAARMAVG